jgi:hypothetical protein
VILTPFSYDLLNTSTCVKVLIFIKYGWGIIYAEAGGNVISMYSD